MSMTRGDVIQLTLTLKMIPHRLSKRQLLSTTTVLFRTSFTQTIILNLLIFFRSHLLKRVIYPLNEWEILREQIEYEEELGRGAFGVVYKAILRKRVGIEVFNTEVSERTLLSSETEPQVVAVKILHGKIKNEIKRQSSCLHNRLPVP